MSKHFSTDNSNDDTVQQGVLDRTEPDVELLIAYLDGELDTQAVRQMEDRLSVEPDLREKMTTLEQTWNMLDELETVPADKELVRSTMEVVALTIEKELNETGKKSGQRKWFDRLILLATLLMFGVVGFQLATLAGIHVKNQIVDDIPIIRNMSMYKEIGSFEFLKALSEKQVFDPPAENDVSRESPLPDETPAVEAVSSAGKEASP